MIVMRSRPADAGGALPAHEGRSRARLARFALLALLVLGLTGCASVTDTLGALSSDGFSSPSVTINSDGTGTEVTVSSPHHATLSDDDAEARAAELVWRRTPVRFDRVHIVVGRKNSVFSREQLTGVFGPRDPALDARSVGDDVASTFAWVGVVVLVVLAVAAAVVVLLVRRSRRRRAAFPQPPAPWGAPGQPPYPGQPHAGRPQPGQPYPGQPQPGQPYPGQPYAGQPQPGQPQPNQPYAGQSPTPAASRRPVEDAPRDQPPPADGGPGPTAPR